MKTIALTATLCAVLFASATALAIHPLLDESKCAEPAQQTTVVPVEPSCSAPSKAFVAAQKAEPSCAAPVPKKFVTTEAADPSCAARSLAFMPAPPPLPTVKDARSDSCLPCYPLARTALAFRRSLLSVESATLNARDKQLERIHCELKASEKTTCSKASEPSCAADSHPLFTKDEDKLHRKRENFYLNAARHAEDSLRHEAKVKRLEAAQEALRGN